MKSVSVKQSKINRTLNKIKKILEIPKFIHNDNERQRRVYSINSKSPTILARADTTKILVDNKIRKLTPLECERLQTIPDNYTCISSDTQRYKMIGNAFTVSIIKHFLKSIDKDPKIGIEEIKTKQILKQKQAKIIQGELFI